MTSRAGEPLRAPGLLVIDKPTGPTSHDVVDVVRRVVGLRQVGHAGTLDPLATGVLVVLVGAATRLAEFLVGHDKRYRTVVRLGATTATDDAEGPILVEQPITATADDIRAALARFRGRIEQRPPSFAAVKQDGERAYARARRGETVVVAPRPVTIHAIELVSFDPPLVTLDVHCSTGTYVRSLARDLGESLGCGAHVADLRRTASGPFDIGRATPLAAITPGNWLERLLPPETGILDWPRLDLGADDEQRIRRGQSVAARAEHDEHGGDRWRAHGPGGRFLAVVRRKAGQFLPEKVF